MKNIAEIIELTVSCFIAFLSIVLILFLIIYGGNFSQFTAKDWITFSLNILIVVQSIVPVLKTFLVDVSSIEYILSNGGTKESFRNAANSINDLSRFQLNDGLTLLMSACKHGRAEFVEVLLEEKRVDPNYYDKLDHRSQPAFFFLNNRDSHVRILTLFLRNDVTRFDVLNLQGQSIFLPLVDPVSLLSQYEETNGCVEGIIFRLRASLIVNGNCDNYLNFLLTFHLTMRMQFASPIIDFLRTTSDYLDLLFDSANDRSTIPAETSFFEGTKFQGLNILWVAAQYGKGRYFLKFLKILSNNDEATIGALRLFHPILKCTLLHWVADSVGTYPLLSNEDADAIFSHLTSDGACWLRGAYASNYLNLKTKVKYFNLNKKASVLEILNYRYNDNETAVDTKLTLGRWIERVRERLPPLVAVVRAPGVGVININDD